MSPSSTTATVTLCNSAPPSMTGAIACPSPVKRLTNTSFAGLPEEITVRILECCDFSGVLACQLTCHALRDVVASSTRLRYKLALSEHRMCDGTFSELSAAHKLVLLTAHIAAWQSLESIPPERASMLLGWSAPMAVSGNVIVFSKRVRPDGPIEAEEPALVLLVLRVPSALRRIEAAHWSLALPANVSALCIDSSQDLLIYVFDCKFYVCTLSTAAVHSLVEHAGSFSMWNGSRRGDVFNLCVHGDFVAAGTRVYFISVWNWKTGQFVSDQKSEVHFSSFCFLDEHQILYAASNQDSIYVYDVRRPAMDRQQQQPQLQKGQVSGTEMGPVRFQLALPSLERATMSRYIQICHNALPTGKVELWQGSSSGSAPPFYADPRERLIVLRLVTSPVERGEERFELHVPARALLEHAAAVGRCRRGDKGEAVLSWSAWGDAARVTPLRRLPYAMQAQMVAYGMRVVSHPPDWDERRVARRLVPPASGKETRRSGGRNARCESGGGETRRVVGWDTAGREAARGGGEQGGSLERALRGRAAVVQARFVFEHDHACVLVRPLGGTLASVTSPWRALHPCGTHIQVTRREKALSRGAAAHQDGPQRV
ncbi:hypothetical protein F5148DRAFT_1367474 [Russula earlei]|uniref:Uncharacterized protein n=1 Tax=Russula earlei TaxID=71964 RepID=A0ACC0UCB8_9AGAM|nr:hypothetical protein F5148DRAFT_1367474 [Russula earlei]